ncbi:MAG: hypothetical protein V1875_10470 [Candidatus Altiarchaeota archaeon]
MRVLLAVSLILLLCGCIGGKKQAGSEDAIVCPPPYLRVGNECCLDRDGNDVCDRDETTTTEPAPTTTEEPTTSTEAPTTTAPATTLAPTTTVSPSTTAPSTTSSTTLSTTTTSTLPLPCTDTDGGKVVELKGTVTRGATVLTDRCESSASLLEYYCLTNNRTSSELVQCPKGCYLGSCGGCSDTDGGDYPEVYGEVSVGKELTKRDRCQTIGDGKTLQEYYCLNSTDLGSRQVYCDAGCSDGRCI